ncbi:MAG: hypothetical protein WCR21_02250 [Bacteroidota bacterium]
MKTTIKILSLCLALTFSQKNYSQTKSRTSLAIVSIDTKELSIDPISMGNMVRTEVEKLDTFNVTDRYDVQQFMETNKVSMSNCYGKICLVEIGIQLKVNKMLTGSIELVGKNIIVTYRLVDVLKNEVERTYVHEFLSLPDELKNMVKLSVAQMFNKIYDKNLMEKLSKKNAFDNSNNNPQVERLALDGPRMGFTSFTGKNLDIIQGKKSEGGFDLFPVMFQFGYQFEKQYLNEGKVQALFEGIPMITGLDQGYFIPSFTLLHGLRSNVNGWEFAFGPSINIAKMASGFYDASGKWNLEGTWDQTGKKPEMTSRMDYRGNFQLQSYFVLAVGRTFKSGKLNIPVNIFLIPGRDGFRYGFSFGFNARNNKY